MQVEANIITKQTVKLDDPTIRKVIVEELRSLYDIPKDSYIDKEGYLVQTWEERYGHSYDIEEERVREATATDKAVLELLDTIDIKLAARRARNEL